MAHQRSSRLPQCAARLAAAAVIACSALATPSMAQEGKAAKPNILFIMGDDIGWSSRASTIAG